MATKYRLQDVSLLGNKGVFIDTNVFIYMYWSTNSNAWEQNYVRVFTNLLRKNTALYVDFLVISEIINRVLRIEHNRLQPNIDFKRFRDSQEGKNSLSDIYLIVQNDILSKVNVVGKAYNKQAIENFLAVDSLDFIDKSIVELCKDNSLVLLTNDRDFKNSNIDILSGNPNILSP
jgi:predicted nucleic acid-binding protein